MANGRPLDRRALMGAALALAAATTLAAPPASADFRTTVDAGKLSKSKRTPLGLYLTPTDAHAALTNDPAIVFIDVRDPTEISFVGHPSGLDAIVPLRIATHQIDPKTHQYRTKANSRFVEDVGAVMTRLGQSKSDPVFVTCRSGSRSATATRMLAAAGYTNVWNLVEGFEGGKAADGSRSRDGWRNAGLPWGYKLAEGVAWSPSR